MPRDEIGQLIKKLKKQGWTATKTNGNHWKLKGPAGALYFTGSTPGDARAIRNATADLRKLGAKL